MEFHQEQGAAGVDPKVFMYPLMDPSALHNLSDSKSRMPGPDECGFHVQEH